MVSSLVTIYYKGDGTTVRLVRGSGHGCKNVSGVGLGFGNKVFVSWIGLAK